MNRLLWIVFLVVALLVLVANEWLSVRQNESAFRQAMDRQANAILFSINQNCWDLASSWNDAWQRRARRLADGDSAGLAGFLASNGTVAQWWYERDDGAIVNFAADSSSMPVHELQEVMARQQVGIEELAALLQSGYRKLEPVVGLPDGMQGLWGVMEAGSAGVVRAGFLYRGGDFILGRITPMLQTAGADELAIGVFVGPDDSLVTANRPFVPSPDDPRNSLWIFPDTWLVLDLQNDQYASMVDGRLRRSGFMLALAGLFLGVGLVLVYRSVRRQTQLAQMKTDFVANVSHELRTPLSLIRMFAETLEMGRIVDDAKRVEYYRIIGSESERLGYMINNILDFNRMEAGEKHFQMAPVSLNEVVRGVMDTYRYTLEARQFTWESHCAPEEPVIEADRAAVVEICINLLENAIKYSPGTKFVKVSTHVEPDAVSLTVEDHGIGIAPEHQRRIFELFYRVESSLTAKTRGSGLGLAIVKRIADAHRAEVAVASAVGKGSRFTVKFPKTEEETE